MGKATRTERQDSSNAGVGDERWCNLLQQNPVQNPPLSTSETLGVEWFSNIILRALPCDSCRSLLKLVHTYPIY